jgi:hypothetical protein
MPPPAPHLNNHHAARALSAWAHVYPEVECHAKYTSAPSAPNPLAPETRQSPWKG